MTSRDPRSGPDVCIAEGSDRNTELFRNLCAGDIAAFDQLYRTHFPGMWRFAYGLVRNRDDAEELVQDTFAMVWNRRADLDPDTRIPGYLYGIVRNAALKHLRHTRVEVREQEIMLAGGDPLGFGAVLPLPDALTDNAAMMDVLDRAIASLPEARRTAAVLRWKVGLSYPEIAGILGTTPDAVRVNVTRVKSMLADVLRPFET